MQGPFRISRMFVILQNWRGFIDFLKYLYLERDVNNYAAYIMPEFADGRTRFAFVLSARVPVSSGAIWLSFLLESGDDDKLRYKHTRASRNFLRVEPGEVEKDGVVTSGFPVLVDKGKGGGLFISWS